MELKIFKSQTSGKTTWVVNSIKLEKMNGGSYEETKNY